METERTLNGRYALTGLIGRGGMGDVYLARDGVLGRDVAVKLLKEGYASGASGARERFEREAENAAMLSHPHIVQVYDMGETEDGVPFIVMEHVPGETLAEKIRREGPLDALAAAGVGAQVARALAAAHEKGVVHRDIKPHNVFVAGETAGTVKVGDFGIARTLDGASDTTAVLGTARYVSPEQAKGEPVGPASDLYSLGVTLYEMLTGRAPFDGPGGATTPLAVAMRHVTEEPPPPHEVDPGVPEGISAVTMRLLNKGVGPRYGGDARAVAEDLERIARGLEPGFSGAAHDDADEGAEHERPRRKLLVAGLAAGLIMAAAGVAFALSDPPAPPEPRESGQTPVFEAPAADESPSDKGSRSGPEKTAAPAAAPEKAEPAGADASDAADEELEEAVRAYYEAVDAEDFSYTYGHLASESRSMFSGEEEWVRKNDWYAENYPLKLASMEVSGDVTPSSTDANVTVDRTFTDGGSFTRETRFVYEDGEWRHALSGEEIAMFGPGTPFEEFVGAPGDDKPDEGDAAAGAEDAETARAEAEDAVRGHYEAIGEGDLEEAYSYFGPTYRADEDEPAWTTEVKSFEVESASVNAVEVGEVSADATRAAAAVDVSFEDNTGEPRFNITWELVKEGSGWKLDRQIAAESAE